MIIIHRFNITHFTLSPCTFLVFPVFPPNCRVLTGHIESFTVLHQGLVPKMPQLYAALIRAAVWDCIFVGVFVAQLVDLANVPFLKGIDSGHYLPCVPWFP